MHTKNESEALKTADTHFHRVPIRGVCRQRGARDEHGYTQTHTASLLHTAVRFGVRLGHRLPQG